MANPKHTHAEATPDAAPCHGHDHGLGEGHNPNQNPDQDPNRDMGHGHHHSHGVGGHSHGPVNTGDWRYAVGLVVNLLFVVIEFGAGWWSNSAALMADAGHNLSDVLGLAMAGGAAWLSRRASSASRTYGYGKATILAALGNALLLIFACGVIAVEAVRRFAEPAPVGSTTVMVVAGIGILINLGTALLFMKDQSDLNARGAYLHMMADAAVSVGVVVAGAVIWLTGWPQIDPLFSLVIVAVILWSTWGLLKDSVNLALDGAPRGLDVSEIRAAFLALDGVSQVHDLHVWGLSTTEAALTAHLVHDRGDAGALLIQAQTLAHDRFGIEHTTFQLEAGQPMNCPSC